MQAQLETTFHADGSTVFDQEFWNRFVREVAARLRGFDGIKIAWEEVSRQGIDVALARINETLGPAAERIRRLTELGFLVASSETPAALELGAILRLVVTAGDTRDLFSPSPFLLLGRIASPDDYAVVRFRSYDREGGTLEVEVVSFAGDPGPHEDWSLGALAGSTLAQVVMLDQTRALHAEMAEAFAQLDLAFDQVDQAREQAQTSAGQAEAARAAAKILYDATVEAARPLTSERVFAAIAWTRKAAAYAAKSGDRILADTSAGPFAITLPAAGEVEIQDAAGTWSTHNLTIIPGVKPIRGCVGNLVCDEAARLSLTFDPAADAWVASKADGVRA